MKKSIEEIKKESVKQAAFLIMNKMLTAPKGKGASSLEILYIDDEEKQKLVEAMIKYGEQINRPSFKRDANNIRKADGIILIGSKKIVLNLDCGLCTVPTCTESVKKGLNCVFPIADLGIAIGAGVALAADLGIDNRVMYTVGEPSKKINLFKETKIQMVLGMPLSIASKNIFFDRK